MEPRRYAGAMTTRATTHPAAAAVADDPMGDRINDLRDRLAAEKRLVVGYSGGADSAFLAVMARTALGDRALAVTAVSPSLAVDERAAAREFARTNDLRHLEVCTDESDRPEYQRNDADRCYHCKTALFDALDPLVVLLDASVALGTNLDDLGDHRPGQRAAGERGVIAPLVDAGFTKNDVRLASRRLGLHTADKPAQACLASRVAYGEPVTPEVLARVDSAESALRRLGYDVCRVRSHGDGAVARLEVPADMVDAVVADRERIDAEIRSAGFSFVSVDLAAFESGRMNVLLAPTRSASREE